MALHLGRRAAAASARAQTAKAYVVSYVEDGSPRQHLLDALKQIA